jgi:hypothetical protein
MVNADTNHEQKTTLKTAFSEGTPMKVTGLQSAILRLLEERGPCTLEDLAVLLRDYPTDEVARALRTLRRNGLLVPWRLSESDQQAAVVNRPNPGGDEAGGEVWKTSRSTARTPRLGANRLQ